MRLIPLLALTCGGCAPPGAPIDEMRQAIYNGTPVAAGSSPETSGVVSVWGQGAAECTGTMLTNDWVITAGHCPIIGYPSPGIQPGNYDTTKPFYPADFVVTHPSLDFQLLHLAQGVTIDNQRGGFQTGFYPNDTGNGTGTVNVTSSDGSSTTSASLTSATASAGRRPTTAPAYCERSW